jgi:hypothetical protein
MGAAAAVPGRSQPALGHGGGERDRQKLRWVLECLWPSRSPSQTNSTGERSYKRSKIQQEVLMGRAAHQTPPGPGPSSSAAASRRACPGCVEGAGGAGRAAGQQPRAERTEGKPSRQEEPHQRYQKPPASMRQRGHTSWLEEPAVASQAAPARRPRQARPQNRLPPQRRPPGREQRQL